MYFANPVWALFSAPFPVQTANYGRCLPVFSGVDGGGKLIERVGTYSLHAEKED